MSEETRHTWIEFAKERGLELPLRVVLDALEPLGPLTAQLLWVLQPALGVFVGHDALSKFANLIEQPDGIASLRALLDDEPPEEH